MKREPSFIRGAIAGTVGGLLGTGAKHLMEAVAPPRPKDREDPPVVLAERVEGHPLSASAKPKVNEAISWTFGALTGTVYGILAEYVPQVGAGTGTAFGAAFWAGAHEIALPALGLTPPVNKLGAYEQGNEFVTHAIYGAVVEFGRVITRNALGGEPRAGEHPAGTNGAAHSNIVIEDGELEVAST